MKIALSSGHGKLIRGAKGPSPWGLDEVDEARRVVENLADQLITAGSPTDVFHDDISKTQSDNLNRIVNWHNAQKRDLDISIHFNAYQVTNSTRGTEVLYVTQQELSAKVSKAIADAAKLPNRGAKKRTDLAFLNKTNKPAILIETCFVDAQGDAKNYGEHFHAICRAAASAISGQPVAPPVEPPTEPTEPPEPIPPPVSSSPRPTQRKGSKGELVVEIQTCLLATPIDGDFGSITEGKVKDFQRNQGLGVDGICGPQTWGALEYVYELPPYTPPFSTLSQAEVDQICAMARSSRIQQYNWKDRGIMPPGYCKGVAVAWGCAYRKYFAGHPAFQEMAIAKGSSGETDTLAWYDSIFRDAGMRNDVAGIDTLRHVYVLLMGLGMRESSGRHCEGRDMSASNVTSDTCEAGAWQASWNIRSFSPSLMQMLFDEYAANSSFGYMDIFKEGVSCNSTSWSNYGSGSGAKFQDMSKKQPTFAAEVCSLGMRKARKHWGPLTRKEAQIRREADELLLEVQEFLAPPVG